MPANDPAYTPAWHLRELIASRKLSPVEVTRYFLERIDRLNPQFNAYLTVAGETAMASARAAEQEVMKREKLGLLHGIPISVKDLLSTREIRTTFGSLVFKEYVPSEDTVSVERVKEAGAIILGKTNTPEFGHSPTTENRLGEPCRNPWDPGRTPGGSSGGAGAAIAAGLSPLALGSDGGGSIRIPSSFCGVYGLKPSRGLVPRSAGVGAPVSNIYSHHGPMTWTVRDAALLLQVISGYDRRDPIALRGPVPDFLDALEDGVRGLRIAWSRDLGYAAVDQEVAEVCERAARVFEELGTTVEEPAIGLEDPASYFWALYLATAYASYGEIYQQHAPLLTEYVRARLDRGSQVTLPQYMRAVRQMEVLNQQIDDIFERYDLLLLPTLASVAFPIGQPPGNVGGREVNPAEGFRPFTHIFNMTGNPAASIPCGFSQDGLPIGLHIIGREGDDATVLRASYAFEQAHPWQGRRPGVAV